MISFRYCEKSGGIAEKFKIQAELVSKRGNFGADRALGEFGWNPAIGARDENIFKDFRSTAVGRWGDGAMGNAIGPTGWQPLGFW
jgi:hypothetical protein